MGLQRFEYSSKGYIALMQSPGVQRDLARRGAAVKAALDAAWDQPRDWEIITNVHVGRTRARAIVSGVPLNVEYARRLLGSALDAARQ